MRDTEKFMGIDTEDDSKKLQDQLEIMNFKNNYEVIAHN